MRKSWLPRHRVLRAAVLVALAVVGLELLYLVVANVALLASKRRFAGVTFESAFTLYPGSVALRGVEVENAHAWAIAASSADVRFAPWELLGGRKRVASVTAEVTSVTVESGAAKRRASGQAHVVARDVTIADGRVSLALDATVAGTTLESDGAVLSRDVEGQIALRVAPVDPTRSTPLAETSGRIDLHGTFVSFAPLVSAGSLATEQDAGTFRVAVKLDAGLVDPASEIVAHTDRATIGDARGAGAELPRGLDVRLGVSKSKADELALSVRTPSVIFDSPDAAQRDSFDELEVVAPAGSIDLKRTDPAPRTLAWTVRSAVLREAASVLRAAAHGDFSFDAGKPGEASAHAGHIVLEHVVIDSPGEDDHAPFDATVAIRAFTFTRERGVALRGDVHASGKDPRPLLELFVASPTIRGALRSIRPKSFTFDALLDRGRGRLAFDDLVLVAKPLTVRGGYRRVATTTSGAFLVGDDTLTFGVELRDGHESIALGATPAWLARALSHPR